MNLSNVDYNDFIRQEGKPMRYKMSCLQCGKSKGHKPIAYWNRRCHACSDRYLSKIKTKTSITQRKLKQKIPSIICDRLKSNGVSKRGNKILKILGYTFEDLIQRLESQFEPWMNWKNHGICRNNIQTWQIDHIIPDSSFNYSSIYDEDFKNSWALENLRPLCAKKNLRKGSNI